MQRHSILKFNFAFIKFNIRQFPLLPLHKLSLPPIGQMFAFFARTIVLQVLDILGHLCCGSSFSLAQDDDRFSLLAEKYELKDGRFSLLPNKYELDDDRFSLLANEYLFTSIAV